MAFSCSNFVILVIDPEDDSVHSESLNGSMKFAFANRQIGRVAGMVLPNVDIPEKVKFAFSRDAETDQLPLPVLLSSAGILIILILAIAVSLESWLGSSPNVDLTTSPAELELVAAAPQSEILEHDSRAQYIQLSRQIDTLHVRIEQLEMDFERVSASNKSMSIRLQNLENDLGPYTSSITPGQPVPFNQEVVGISKRDNLSTHFKPTATGLKSLDGDTDTEFATTVRVGQHSTQTLFALKLPSFRTIGELSSGWRNIRNRTGDSLTGLEPRSYATIDQSSGTVYRLIAGPIRNAAEAASRCVRLNKIGVHCETTHFSGERLTNLFQY